MLGISRSAAYVEKSFAWQDDLILDRRLDELYTAHPFLGYRKLTVLLRKEGLHINGKRVRRAMKRLGIAAIYPKPNTSISSSKNAVFPYLLKGVTLVSPNHVWATDITYIRTRIGYVYLIAVIDWFSRYVLAWRLSTTMETYFCLQALDDALEQGTPLIFNTDQGSQFTSHAFVGRLQKAGIRVSMDGRGSYHDNIFTERLWRSVKYEEVYLREYRSITDATEHLRNYFLFYNNNRPHQALEYKTPANVHREQTTKKQLLIK